MTTKRKSLISISVIQKQYALSFVEVMAIVDAEKWKFADSGRMTLEKDMVLSYFQNKGITQKRINYKGIMQQFGVSKQDVFKLIHEQKWKPISTGKDWLYAYEPIAKFFESAKNKQ